MFSGAPSGAGSRKKVVTMNRSSQALLRAVTVLTLAAVTLLVVSPALAKTTDDRQDPGWPRQIKQKSATITIYQPQVEELNDNSLTARAAVSVKLGDDEPVFGAMWFESQIHTDRDSRMVYVDDIVVSNMRFPDASDEQRAQLKELVEKKAGKADLSYSLDRLLTSVENTKREVQSTGLNNDPPTIIHVTYPTLLVLLDGDPELRDLEGSKGKLMHVVNTPYLIVLDTRARDYYLYGGSHWYSAKAVEGPWAEATIVPEEIQSLGAQQDQAKADAGETDDAPQDDRIPNVMVATEPTELLITDGDPTYTPLEGTDLLHVSNSENDILRSLDDQELYTVLSGRWYRSTSLEGPWTYVAADELPEDFVNIPGDSDAADARVYVAGTDEAEEAILDAQVPQTAAVKRKGTTIEVEYDGKPQFKPIEGTDMEYAINTASSVLKIDGKYYACESAVWYVADAPTGPWKVSDSRPDDVENIPPTNPTYNTKYVYVYDSTPDVVYCGYTHGYTGGYIYGPTIVYGTGWYYRPWIGTYYYPRPYTYGFRVNYNPWYGWSFGFSFSTGPFTFSIGRGGYGGWWGPGGYRPYYPRYGYRGGYRPVNINTGDININTGNNINIGNNIYNRPENKDRVARTQDMRRDGKPAPAVKDRANNVFTDRDGNVFKRDQSGNWEQRTRDGWSKTDGVPGTRERPSAGGDRPATRPSNPSARPGTADRANPSTRDRGTPPATRDRPSQPSRGSKAGSRGGGYGGSGLNRDSHARQRGSSRANSYQRSRSYGGGGRSAPRGGARGGGRRR